MRIEDNHDLSEKLQRCRALEEELRKILVFQRELPLCLELVTQAIKSCKQQLSGTTTDCNLNEQSECNSGQISSEVPVLEEFIPIKRPRSSVDEEQDSKETKINCDNVKNSKKSDWLRSVQLWNQAPDPPLSKVSPRKVAVVEVKRNGPRGAFHPFKKEESDDYHPAPPQRPLVTSFQRPSTSSSPQTGSGGVVGSRKEEKGGQSHRKSRRCWSMELHRRFLQAVEQLGGSHVATPKQIREMMKVDGLTNDEVKSHLQKYRLHSRRPTPYANNNQAPHFAVVVGRIWTVPPEYAAAAGTTSGGSASVVATTPDGIYASLVQREHQMQLNSGESGSPDNVGVPSHSSVTSLSTQTC